jgi:hypothetical protein
MNESDETKLEEIKFAVETGVTDREFWQSRTPEARIWAMELMRRRVYSYDEHSVPKLERVIEVATLKHYSPRPSEAKNATDLPPDQS